MKNWKRVLLKVIIISGLLLAGAITALILIAIGSRIVGNATGSSGSSSGYGSAAPLMARSADYDYVEESAAFESESYLAADDYDSSAPDTAAEIEQKIIKTGTLSFEVEDVAETIQAITDITTAAGGFVQSSESWQTSATQLRGEITARVPSEKFESTVEDTKALALVVKSESVSGQDVTEQYTDLAARLENAQKQEEELRRLLERANTVDEILKVQKQLNSAREDVEVLQGRLNYLENQTSFSTITFDLREEASVEVPSKAFRPWTAVKEASRALLNLFQSVVIVGIWIVIVLGGLLIPVVIVIWILYRIARRIMQKMKAKQKNTTQK